MARPRILSEFVEGFDALAEIGPAITVFGSARRVEGDPAYTMAREIGRLLALEGYAVITGGGPGVMEAANRGCQEGGGLSVGCNIELPTNSRSTPCRPRGRVPLLLRAQDDVREVRRRVRDPARRLRHDGRAVRGADAHPDGQDPALPVVLVGTAFFAGFVEWIKAKLLGEGMISPEDLDLIQVTDDPKRSSRSSTGPVAAGRIASRRATTSAPEKSGPSGSRCLLPRDRDLGIPSRMRIG